MDSQSSHYTTTEQPIGKELLEQYERAVETIDEFQKKLNLPFSNINSIEEKAHELCSLSVEQRNKMTWEECQESEYYLKVYQAFLEKVLSQIDSKINIIKELINRFIAREVDNYSGYSYQERVNKAVNGNYYAQRLDKTRALLESQRIILSSASKSVYGVASAFSRRK